VKLYGIPASQASRCLWVLEEIGLDYELETVRPGEGTVAPGFEQLNPNRKIPVLEDEALVLSESLAINWYLAESYGGGLLPPDLADRSRVMQWTFWVAHDVEPHLWRMWQNSDPDAAVLLRGSLEILDEELRHRDWVVGDEFSLADLNLESYIIRARRGGYRLQDHGALFAWIERCEARPARIRVREMIQQYEATPSDGRSSMMEADKDN
jgi:glutathione S-transferase